MKFSVFVFVIAISSPVLLTSGEEYYSSRGFRTKTNRNHMPSMMDNRGIYAAASSTNSRIKSLDDEPNSGVPDTLKAAADKESTVIEDDTPKVKQGGDREEAKRIADAFMKKFVEKFGTDLKDLKIAVDKYSKDGGDIRFNFQHTSQDDINGQVRTNNITCTSVLGSDPLPSAFDDDDFFNSRDFGFGGIGKKKDKLGFAFSDEELGDAASELSPISRVSSPKSSVAQLRRVKPSSRVHYAIPEERPRRVERRRNPSHYSYDQYNY